MRLKSDMQYRFCTNLMDVLDDKDTKMRLKGTMKCFTVCEDPFQSSLDGSLSESVVEDGTFRYRSFEVLNNLTSIAYFDRARQTLLFLLLTVWIPYLLVVLLLFNLLFMPFCLILCVYLL